MSHVPLPLDGRIAVVTGANHGIGAATARRLAALGADVLVTYFRPADPDPADPDHGDQPPEYHVERARTADHVVADVEALGRRAVSIELDLRDAAAVPAVFDRAEASFGPVDVLVNNASGWVADTLAPVSAGAQEPPLLDADSIDRVMAVDARAAALLIAEFARRLVGRDGSWGRIVGLTSAGRSGFPGQVSYGAAKAAQVSVTLSAATELAPFGVTANIVHPPITDTGWVDDGVRELVASTPGLTHVAEPDEVAEVIGWLCTDAARLVSGTILELR